MKVAIGDIQIAERVRHDLGDIEPLAESLERIGQLNPITLSQRNELIAGHRRVLAAQKLGWTYIEARIVDMASDADRLELELEENVYRKDFSPDELLEGYRKLEKLRRPSMTRRIGCFFRRMAGFLFGWMVPKRKKPNNTADPQPASPETTDTEQTAEPDDITVKQLYPEEGEMETA